jgi:hypothetical protein
MHAIAKFSDDNKQKAAFRLNPPITCLFQDNTVQKAIG